jgi:hypothetical protein
MQTSTQNPDPRYHAGRITQMLSELVTHLREDTKQFDEPKAQAMFETAAEVLQGLQTAFRHYESGKEAAMRPASAKNR